MTASQQTHMWRSIMSTFTAANFRLLLLRVRQLFFTAEILFVSANTLCAIIAMTAAITQMRATFVIIISTDVTLKTVCAFGLSIIANGNGMSDRERRDSYMARQEIIQKVLILYFAWYLTWICFYDFRLCIRKILIPHIIICKWISNIDHWKSIFSAKFWMFYEPLDGHLRQRYAYNYSSNV